MAVRVHCAAQEAQSGLLVAGRRASAFMNEILKSCRAHSSVILAEQEEAVELRTAEIFHFFGIGANGSLSPASILFPFCLLGIEGTGKPTKTEDGG